jgi:hypothetical protein
MQIEQLNDHAERVLESLNSGEIEFDGQFQFGGVSREKASWRFEGRMEDLETDDERNLELKKTLVSVPLDRRMTLIAHPELATDAELSEWLEASGVFDQIFDLGYLFPLTLDKKGPCMIAGTHGDLVQPDYEIFVVAQTWSEAASLWEKDWLEAIQLFTRRGWC